MKSRELIKLAKMNPELRALQKLAIESVLSPGQASQHPEVTKFLSDMERVFRRHFPQGFFSADASRKFNHNSISLTTATLPRGKQSNGILQNDPSYNIFMMHDSYDENGLAPKIKIELIQGGRYYGPNFSNPTKIGWRNGTTSPNNILKKLDQYFAKTKMIAKVYE